MRYAFVFVAVSALGSSGCSVFMARSGISPYFKSRDEVHKTFGEAVACGTKDGMPYEEFRTRRPVADWMRGITNGFGFAMTFGILELYTFPREVYYLGKNVLFGQPLYYSYDPDGAVRRVEVPGNCQPVYDVPRKYRDEDLPRSQPITPLDPPAVTPAPDRSSPDRSPNP